MKYTNLAGIDFGQIQAFVAVADYKSFTKAAEFLHISQPVVSKRISALEFTLDMTLIIRDKKRVSLTPAGRALYTSWSRLIAEMIEAVNNANIYQVGHHKLLTIGYCASFLPKGIGGYFNSIHPDVELYFIKMQYPDLLAKLLSGDIDLMFYGVFGKKDLEQEPFCYKIVGECPMRICCLPSHPFACKTEIEINKLRGQRFIMLSPLAAPMWLSYVTDLCVQERFLPQVAMYVDDVTSLAMNLRSNDQVFVSDYLVSYEGFDITSIPIKNMTSGALLAWNQEKNIACIEEFINAAEEYLRMLKKSGKFGG